MAKTHQKELTSAWGLLPKSYQLVKDNLNVFIFVFSVEALFAIWGFLNWFTDNKTTWSEDRYSATNWFGSFSSLDVSTPAGVAGFLAIALGVVSIAFSLMQVITSLRVSQGKTPDINDVWQEFIKKGLRLLLLLIVLGLIILAGFIALIVPGVILIWRLFLSPFIMLDQDTGIKESIKKSWDMTREHAWPIYSIILVTILLGLAGIFPYIGPIVGFLLGVAYVNAPALRYQELKDRSKTPG